MLMIVDVDHLDDELGKLVAGRRGCQDAVSLGSLGGSRRDGEALQRCGNIKVDSVTPYEVRRERR